MLPLWLRSVHVYRREALDNGRYGRAYTLETKIVDRSLLESALIELDALIADPNSTENSFQKWFEAHPIVFEILGYQRVLPQG